MELLKGKKVLTYNQEQKLWFIFFLAPYVIGLLVFWIGPVIASIFISFTKCELVGSPVWVGFNNYKQLFSDEIFIKSLINTAYYTILSVPLSMICSLLLAVAMNQKLKGIVVFRTAVFMPYISSMVAVALLWS